MKRDLILAVTQIKHQPYTVVTYIDDWKGKQTEKCVSVIERAKDIFMFI